MLELYDIRRVSLARFRLWFDIIDLASLIFMYETETWVELGLDQVIGGIDVCLSTNLIGSPALVACTS